jgi:hypothetical protein
MLGRMAQLRLSRNRVAVGLVCLLSAVAYSTVGLLRLHGFRATTFDLVIFDQAVRGYAGFGPPTTPARGAFLGMGTNFVQLADHFSPILVTLAPLYWIHDGPQTLIVAQAFLLALAIPPLWLYTRRKLGVLLWNDARPLGAPWVVADTKRPACAKYGTSSATCVRKQRKRVAKLLRDGYRVVYVRDGYVVLHRVRQ